MNLAPGYCYQLIKISQLVDSIYYLLGKLTVLRLLPLVLLQTRFETQILRDEEKVHDVVRLVVVMPLASE